MLEPIITSNTILIRWLPGDLPGDEIKQFHIKEPSGKLIQTSSNSHLLTLLSPATKYSFEITTENVNGGLGSFTAFDYTTGKCLYK